jgi:UDP-N-acetylglucosamine 4-epimerase
LSEIKYRSFRQGDVRHSKASIQRAVTELGYDPQFKISSGIDQTLDWFLEEKVN